MVWKINLEVKMRTDETQWLKSRQRNSFAQQV